MLRCAVAAVVLLVALAPGPASAHGPCGCLRPTEGSPGTKVRVAYPLYKVIFDPDRTDLATGPKPLWKEHRGDPPITVFRQTWRYSKRPLNHGGTFVVPRVAPGRYLVALYDGGEAGAHYSWETFTVLRPDRAPVTSTPARNASSDGVAMPVFIGSVLAALLGGLAGGVALYQRRHRTA